MKYMAQFTASQEDKTVAVVFSKATMDEITYWIKLVDAIAAELRRVGAIVVLVIADDESDSLFRHADKKMPDGLIIIGSLASEHIQFLSRLSIPMVWVDGLEDRFPGDIVLADNFKAAYMMTELLAKHQHRRILFMGNVNKYTSSQERCDGFIAYTRDHAELGFNISTILRYSETESEPDAASFEYVKKCLTQKMSEPSAPTAILCANEFAVLWVYSILNSLNLQVPKDISVAGFDDFSEYEYCTPKITTVSISRINLARKAVKALQHRFMSPKDERHIYRLAANIVRRESVSNCNHLIHT